MAPAPIHDKDSVQAVSPHPAPYSPVQLWLLAARPKTLPLAITPVLAGAWLATQRLAAPLAWGVIIAALVAAIGIQISTNLWNDAADGERGTDTAARLGPVRVTGAGLVPATIVRRWALWAAALAIIAGLYLAALGGWPVIVIGCLSLLAGLAYSRGPLPLSHTPLGEVLVLLFFGVVAVGGVVWLLAGRVDATSLLFGAILGLPAAAILLVNNHRDRAGDAEAGRKTLAILIGESASRSLYCALLLATAVMLPAVYGSGLALWIGTAALIVLALPLCQRMRQTPVSAALNLQIPLTAAYQFCALLVAIVTAR